MGQRGTLFIADITGYTSYLSKTELDHARSILQDLLNLLLREIRAPLQVSKLEGDAVLAFTPDGAFVDGETLVTMVETIYCAYRRALELMKLNTTCSCAACATIDQLDLKFCVHHGEFAKQQIGQFVELVGTDVNLLHRLTKNGVAEKIGSGAYAIYTQAAVEAAGIASLAEALMTPHVEAYEHIGEVDCWIQPMHDVWELRRDQLRVVVKEADAWITIRFDLPVPVAVSWEYLTHPETRALFIDSDRPEVDRAAPRAGVGDAYVCAHGKDVTIHHVVDWQPFDYYTYAFPAFGAQVVSTIWLEPTDAGTHVSMEVTVDRSSAKNWLFYAATVAFGKLIAERRSRASAHQLVRRVEDDVAAGRVPDAGGGMDLSGVDVAEAVRSSLACRPCDGRAPP